MVTVVENTDMNSDPTPNSPAELMAIDPAQAPGMDPILQHLLETNLHQQAVSQELAQSVWPITQEQMKQSHSAASIPLPDSC